jgi:hypothetical protein
MGGNTNINDKISEDDMLESVSKNREKARKIQNSRY